jgi:tryptophan synthase alpha chain
MKAHERITAAIRAANEAGRTGLVPFVTAGYPEPQDFVGTLRAVAAVGDVVEVGIPFSDPMADGMTIQRSSFEALQKGVSLAWIFDELEKAGDFDAPLVMMSYLNPLLAFGYERLADAGGKGARAHPARYPCDARRQAEDALRCVTRFRLRGHDYRDHGW